MLNIYNVEFMNKILGRGRLYGLDFDEGGKIVRGI